jgi:hypothetical protein
MVSSERSNSFNMVGSARGIRENGKAGEKKGSDDKGTKLMLNTAVFCLEGCLSKILAAM